MGCIFLQLKSAALRDVGISGANVLEGNAFLMSNNIITSRYGNGWQKLASGLLLQYGYFVGNTTTLVTGSFPISFPTQVVVAIGAMGDNVQTAAITVNFEHTSLSTWRASTNTASQSFIFRYIAIGY